MICWKKIFFRLFFQSDLMIIMTAITLMQMMQPAQLQRLYMQRSLHFFLILREFIGIKMIRHL